jgi:hypothetical protein
VAPEPPRGKVAGLRTWRQQHLRSAPWARWAPRPVPRPARPSSRGATGRRARGAASVSLPVARVGRFLRGRAHDTRGGWISRVSNFSWSASPTHAVREARFAAPTQPGRGLAALPSHRGSSLSCVHASNRAGSCQPRAAASALARGSRHLAGRFRTISSRRGAARKCGNPRTTRRERVPDPGARPTRAGSTIERPPARPRTIVGFVNASRSRGYRGAGSRTG